MGLTHHLQNKINKAKELGLLAQLGWCRELVCVSVHKALPGHRAVARCRQDVMPNTAREVQVQPPVPTKPLLGWPPPQPGARKGNNTLQTSATRSLPTPREQHSPKQQGSPPAPTSLRTGLAEGDARAGSSREQGRRQLKKVLP